MKTKPKNPGIAKARNQLGTLQKVADFINARKVTPGKVERQHVSRWLNFVSRVPPACALILIEGLKDITMRDLYPQHVAKLLPPE